MDERGSPQKSGIAWIRWSFLIVMLGVGSLAPAPIHAAGVPILPDGFTPPPGGGTTTTTSNTTTTNTNTNTDTGGNPDTNTTDVVQDPKNNFFPNNPGSPGSPGVEMAPEPASWILGLFGATSIILLAYRRRPAVSLSLTS
jgi:hypothetical protein